MSFGIVFDGYCVIHAPFATAARRVSFEVEFQRVGVQNFVIIEAEKIDDKDKRLKNFASNESTQRAILSLHDAHRKCIEYAQKKCWQSVAIFEDDIVFRDSFDQLWEEVEEEVLKCEWEVLFLYRWQSKHLKEPSKKVTLLPIDFTFCAHAYVVRSSAFDLFKESIDLAAANGKAVDDGITFQSLKSHSCRVVATSRNLAGQGMFKSSVSTLNSSLVRGSFLEDTFRIQNPKLLGRLHWMVSKAISRISRLIKR